ncbi:DUF3795 domain-containing protein [Clostridium sp. CS001]|uniref:DUF3795 domain-containing protein n=1 Tax=Clostridium sp. CS001 TaxID=2880648 RepID=UPI001CF5C0F0|nr:DUF3795 domain-containing protein [Clostridium sp. CS001]MCB2291170.1 DUF3795 domain-containing protein [Clostridium sp. CS001]
MDKHMIGRCGTYCGVCEWREKTNCPGCQKCNGKPFWGDCSVAKCSIEKGIHHCGHCSDLPCEVLVAAYNTPGHEDNGERLLNLKNWASGKEEYLELRTLKSEDK